MGVQRCPSFFMILLFTMSFSVGEFIRDNHQALYNRSKRNSVNTGSYMVEILAVMDSSIYDFYYRTTNGSERAQGATRLINQHIYQLFKEMDARFESLRRQGLDIHVKLSDIFIIQKVEHSIWLTSAKDEKLNAGDTLASFKKWIMTSQKLDTFDHAMLFTRFDITRNNADTIAGLAYIDRMCSTSSVSLVEDRGSPVIPTIAAHELAHSLGAMHDGSDNSCTSSSNHIMSETSKITKDVTSNRNSWIFSPCSVQYIQNFISSLERNCLTQSRDTTQEAIIIEDRNTYTVPSPDEQCQTIEGKESSLCRSVYKGNYSDFCALMMCRVDENSCSYTIPRDGTSCGINKICQFGHCVNENQGIGFESAPHESCPFGDQLGAVSRLETTCKQGIVNQPFLCYDSTILHTCCESCREQYINQAGCEYGDKELCVSVNIVMCLLRSDVCCNSCKETSNIVLVTVVILGLLATLMVTATLYITCLTRNNLKPDQHTVITGQVCDVECVTQKEQAMIKGKTNTPSTIISISELQSSDDNTTGVPDDWGDFDFTPNNSETLTAKCDNL